MSKTLAFDKRLCAGSRRSMLSSEAGARLDPETDCYTVQCPECFRELRPLKHPGSRLYLIIPAHKPPKDEPAIVPPKEEATVSHDLGIHCSNAETAPGKEDKLDPDVERDIRAAYDLLLGKISAPHWDSKSTRCGRRAR